MCIWYPIMENHYAGQTTETFYGYFRQEKPASFQPLDAGYLMGLNLNLVKPDREYINVIM